jgi:YidC/Oxa1 family membrane protein insertase
VSEQNRNLILAMALSLLIFLGWDYFIMRPQVEAQRIEAEKTAKAAPAASADKPAAAAVLPRAQAIGTSGRVRIQSPTLTGSINLTGARFDDLTLTKYREALSKTSPNIHLLSPSGTVQPHFMQSGWLAQNIAVPGAESRWIADRDLLTPSQPVTLSWTSPQGVTFTQKISLDEQYLFTITHGIHNGSTTSLTFTPYSLISRRKPSKVEEMDVSHEGAVGSLGGTLKEADYGDLEDSAAAQRYEGTQAWLGFADKYWLTAIIPDTRAAVTASVRQTDAASQRFQLDMQWPAMAVAAGKNAGLTVNLFAGAKEVELIDDYQAKLGLTLFDRAIDWGWFWFIAQPFFKILHWLYGIFNNFGVAIIGLTLIVKIALFPLAYKGYQSMSRTKIYMPKIKELQERYKDDKVKLQQEQIELFKREKINPLGGCLPMLLQIPVFFALYKVLYISLEMRHQPFALWIKDLSAPDPLTPVNLFGLLPFTPPAFLAIGVLPILYAITFHFQMKLQPQTSMDPVQQQVFKFMPLVFLFMFSGFSAGLVLYWTVSNILSIAQQWWLMRMEENKMKAAKA